MSSSTPISYIGPYRIINTVYTGQVSRTYQAYDDQNRRAVAVKVLFQDASKDRKQLAFINWEYKVGHPLNNDRVIRFYELGKHGWAPYIAMEWFSALNMKQLMKQGGYGEYCVHLETFIVQMAEALAYLHSEGWVHCDVKPDNFLCSPDQGVKLIDFALARKIKGNFLAKLLGMKQQTQGTASYMSPEQIRGQPIDGRADIYSLGCTFFEMLSGRSIFTGISMNDLLQKHVSASPPYITARNKNVTPEFNDLLFSMLSKKTKDRPVSMSDVASTLRLIQIFKRPPEKGDKVH